MQSIMTPGEGIKKLSCLDTYTVPDIAEDNTAFAYAAEKGTEVIM